jgi:hypothetical protein
MGMFIHATDDSGDNYWDTYNMVEERERELSDFPSNKSWEQACDELGIAAEDIRNIGNQRINEY